MADEELLEPSVGPEPEEESFADLMEAYTEGMTDQMQVGDKLHATILSIGKDTVFVDTGTRMDGVVEKSELLDEKGAFPYAVGDMLDLFVVSSRETELRLSRSLTGIAGWNHLLEAYEKGVPIQGKVKSEIKGGFEVTAMGQRAFCPVSQMDIQYIENPGDYVGATYDFLITQAEERDRNLVLSRRKLLEKALRKEQAAFFEQLEEGAVLEGTVTKLKPYGAFVEVFPGVDGMVHISELGWSRVRRPEDLVSIGDVVRVMVIGIEPGREPHERKISLSVKQTGEDPWETVQERYQPEMKVQGKVMRCAEFGVFVELEPGIEGLVHISEMSYTKRVLRPADEVKPGDTVAVMIKDLDIAKRRISLSIRDAEGDPWVEVNTHFKPGQVVSGMVEKKESFGIFINLKPGITGLLPSSRIRKFEKPALIEKCKPGDVIHVSVESIQPEARKITLGPASDHEEERWQDYVPGEQGETLMAQKLRQALSKKQ